MNILVVWASRHGATQEVADTVAEELTAAGHAVTIRPATDAPSPHVYDAVILGSAVYMAQWEDSMRRYITSHHDALLDRALWAFSVGLSGMPGGGIQDPVRVGPVLLKIQPREHKTFAGRLKPRELSLRERSIARLGGAVEGDFRDWQEIRQWAKNVASECSRLKAGDED
ncbi:MAG: flavodoxin domain-containing protein [Actinomycetaceae bacterium]|nr:flavodoxin domain-containing protein [Actinomycetaceae bacterium]